MMDNQNASYESHLVMKTRKRRVLSLSEKIDLIRLTEKSPKSKKTIAAKFNIPVHTLNTIYASREKIFEKCKGNFANMNLKRLRPSTYPDIEKSLLDWYMKNNRNGHISCLVLREKALQLAKTHGHENFSASYGWIERFKSRNNLKFRKNKDEIVTASVNTILPSCDSFLHADESNVSSEIVHKHKLNKDPLLDNICISSFQLTETKQQIKNEENFDCQSHSSLEQNDADKTTELYTNILPLHLLSEVHLTELNPVNVNCMAENSETSHCNFTIYSVEKAYNVLCSYIESSDENLNEEIFEALGVLKNFISKEKARRAQKKITDYFSYVSK